MLDFFRQKGLSSVIFGGVIVATVAALLIGFGPGAKQGGKMGSLADSCVARVHGTCIDPKSNRAAYRVLFGRGLPPTLKPSSAKRFVVEGLVERELLVAEAERLGLTVSEDEVTDSIFRGDLLLSVPSDDPAVSDQLGFTNGRVSVDRLMPNGFKSKETKQFDMKTYERVLRQLVNRSPSEFREWQRRELLAAKVRDLIKAPIRLSDDEVFDRYVDERSTATIRHIIVRKGWVEKYAISPEDIAAPQKKAEMVLERVKKGEDFAELAKQFSEDPGSKDKGGQYPAEMVQGFVAEFKKSVAGLKPGEVDPHLVKTDFGFHIIKRDPATPEDIEKSFKAANATGDMDAWAKANPSKIAVPVRHILIGKGTIIDDRAKAIATDIIADIKGGKSAADAAAAAVAKFGKYAPKAPPKTADADAGVPPTETFTAATDPQRPQVITSAPFNRGGNPIPAISPEATESLVKFAFDGQPNDVDAEPIKTSDGFIVVQIAERKAATKEDFEKERDTYEIELLRSKQGEAFAYYVRRLRDQSRSEIKIDEKLVYGVTGDGGVPREDEEE